MTENEQTSEVTQATEATVEGGQTTEATVEEAKTAETPIEYTDFTVPEGFELSDGDKAWLKEYGQKGKLSQEQAQELIDKQVSAFSKYHESAKEQWESTKKEWENGLKNDPELGGKNLESTNKAKDRVLKSFGSDDLGNLLKDYGLDQHVEVARFLKKIADATAEDKMVGTGGSGENKKSAAEILYGKTA